MRDTINPKKAIAVIGIAAVVVVGGYILGMHIFAGGTAAKGEAAVTATPSPSPSDTYEYTIENEFDGIIGKDTSTASPEASSTPDAVQTDDTPDAMASTAPAGNTSGSSGTGSTPSTSTGSTSSTPSASSGSGSTGSTPSAGNNSGQVYVPGFGYVTPSTSGNTQTTSDSDGDINKQVGTMGS